MKTKDSKDFWAGLMFMVTGAAFAIGAHNYPFGESARPGPAYFPFGLGILLALLGAFVTIKALVTAPTDGDRIGHVALKPLAIVIAAIVSFAVALPLLGLVFALPLLIVVISFAGGGFRWKSVVINCVILTAGSWGIFVKGLGLTLPVLPPFLG